jgi:long-chain acyl-CoA synthetase
MMYHFEKPDNLVDLLSSSIAKHADNPIFGSPDSNGDYTWVTYRQVGNRVDALRAGLAKLGVVSGDAVGIIANNRVEWAVAAFATFGLGGQFIPMYEKELVKTWQYIIKDSGIKVLFVSNLKILKLVQSFRTQVPELEHLYMIDGTGAPTMKELEARGKRQPVKAMHPKPEDIAVLIYTSGTTGKPKGVLLSHGNFTSNVIAGGARFPEIINDSCSLSILPWAHSYGLTAELYTFIYKGASMGFIRDITTIADDMVKVAPTFLIAVPRVFNKIYDALWLKINKAGRLSQKLFKMGLKSAAEKRILSEQGKMTMMSKLKYALADRIVFRKIRKRFGGRLKGSLTGSALMNMEVAQFFADIGFPVFDAYGLTETSPAVTINNRIANKPGSVGRPIDHVRVVIEPIDSSIPADEGEIVVYGPNVMQGYHNNPEATRKVMTKGGGFRTGDIGRLDKDGFLFITGRIKEKYKLENGKYVFPAAIEEGIQLSPWVENVMVFGEGHSHNVCLVTPDFSKLTQWAKDQGIDPTPKSMVADSRVIAKISESIKNHLKNKVGGYEIPKSYILIEESFSVENGMLTQTMKLKRREVLNRYADQIYAAYEQTR